jgi:catechol 2,3-dioxygenase
MTGPRLISRLAHVQLLAPTRQETLDFFTGVLGLCESDRARQSVYLRGRGDYFHHSVVLTEAPDSRYATTNPIGSPQVGPVAGLEHDVEEPARVRLDDGWLTHAERARAARAPGEENTFSMVSVS